MLQYFYAVDDGKMFFLTCARLDHNIFYIFMPVEMADVADHTPGTRHTICATHKFSQ